MQQQEYLPLANFLRHQSAYCTDETALESLQAQEQYNQALFNGRLSDEQMAARQARLNHLIRRYKATCTDNRSQYAQRLTQPGTVAAFRAHRKTAIDETGRVLLAADVGGVAA